MNFINKPDKIFLIPELDTILSVQYGCCVATIDYSGDVPEFNSVNDEIQNEFSSWNITEKYANDGYTVKTVTKDECDSWYESKSVNST